MFYASTIHLPENRVEVSTIPLQPEDQRAQALCSLFREFLAKHGPNFREPMPFVPQGDWELQWGVAAQSVGAFVSFFEDGRPCSTAVLLRGTDPAADQKLVAALTGTVLSRIANTPPVRRAVITRERPLMIHVLFPPEKELSPTLQLMATALASVFFRAESHSRQPLGK